MQSQSCSLIEVLDAFLGMTSSTSGGRMLTNGATLVAIEIEERFIGWNYSFLFMHSVLKQHILPIGLYRSPKKVDPISDYKNTAKFTVCYTNPHPETTINAGDRVYILKPENITNESVAHRSLHNNVHRRGGYMRHTSKHGGNTKKWEDLSQEVTLDELRTAVERLQREMQDV